MPVSKLRGLFLGFIFLVAPTHARVPLDTANRIDRYISPLVEAGQFSGVVMAIEGGEPVYERAFGLANAELGVRNTPDTVFGFASITKTMTTVILEALVAEQRLSPTDPVSRFIPGFPHGDRITVDMLSRHRSGIPHRVTSPEEEAMPLSFDEMVARIGRAPLAFPPGEGRLYSSSAYVLLARILEVASGRSYAELLDRYVFAPAGMTRAAEFDAEAIVAGRASDYLPSPQGPRNAAYKDYGFLTGAGSVYGTADDLLAFGRAILAGTYGEALKARAAPNGVYAANGSTNGHRAFIRLDANSGRGVVLVTNLNSGAIDLVISSVDAILSGQDPASATIPQPRVTVRPPADLGRYAGSWLPRANPNGMPFALTVRAGGLHMGDFRLYPTEGGCFFEYQFYGELCFSPRDGPPSTVRWQAPGFDLEWERAPT